MVEAYIYLYTGEDNGLFTKGMTYFGRTNKAGDKMARCDRGTWEYVINRGWALSRLRYKMEIVETFHVANHKIALTLGGNANEQDQ